MKNIESVFEPLFMENSSIVGSIRLFQVYLVSLIFIHGGTMEILLKVI